MINVDEAGAFFAAVRVMVAEQVGLQGLFENAEAVTPVGRAVRILKVTGEVLALAFSVAVAVSTLPVAPGVIVSVEGEAVRVKSKKPDTTRVNVAV